MATTYDPKKVKFVLGGVPITNLAKDTAISFSYENDAVSAKETLENNAVFSVMRSLMGTLSVTAEANSNIHAIVTALYQDQHLTGGGAVPFAIINYNVPDGSALLTGVARVKQMPTMEFGAESPTTEYSFVAVEVKHFVASIPDGGLFDL